MPYVYGNGWIKGIDMNRIALIAALLLTTSGAALANDFSGGLAFPAKPAPAAERVDRTVTFSTFKAEKSKPAQDGRQADQDTHLTRK
jgi:hypothetical protein